eukprot:TRINITY_DN1487_c0_g1_i1.p2 TRINITY_DN1487_c0_g1~~TRINITY_DN1487_c0_g1_i1.p2  ORF type:complete len:261 (-),score=110.25 TRINITY_DN1487_c0_g1_i1:58-810(-)
MNAKHIILSTLVLCLIALCLSNLAGSVRVVAKQDPHHAPAASTEDAAREVLLNIYKCCSTHYHANELIQCVDDLGITNHECHKCLTEKLLEHGGKCNTIAHSCISHCYTPARVRVAAVPRVVKPKPKAHPVEVVEVVEVEQFEEPIYGEEEVEEYQPTRRERLCNCVRNTVHRVEEAAHEIPFGTLLSAICAILSIAALYQLTNFMYRLGKMEKRLTDIQEKVSRNQNVQELVQNFVQGKDYVAVSPKKI